MQNAPYIKRLIWHSRRGMLELDLLLEPFARHELPKLSLAEQAIYERLLQAQDPDIHAWLMGNIPCPDPEINHLVERIRHYATHSTLP